MQLFGGELNWWQGEPPLGQGGQSDQVLARGTWVVQLWSHVWAGLETSLLPLYHPQLQPNWWEWGMARGPWGRTRESEWPEKQQSAAFPKLLPKRRVNLIILSEVLLDYFPHILSLSIFSSLPLWFFFSQALSLLPRYHYFMTLDNWLKPQLLNLENGDNNLMQFWED